MLEMDLAEVNKFEDVNIEGERINMDFDFDIEDNIVSFLEAEWVNAIDIVIKYNFQQA